MRIIFIDFESKYSQDYSLRKMTPIEYITDDRWETIGCAVIDGVDGEPVWFEGDTVADWLSKQDLTQVAICAHNTQFDGLILTTRYQIYPAFYLDTLAMSRAQLGHVLPGGKVGLANVAKYLGFDEKGTALLKVVGMGAQEMRAAGLYDELVEYALHDVDLCRLIYKHLINDFPPAELLVVDEVTRMATCPIFRLDRGLLDAHLARIVERKDSLLKRVGLTKLELMSDEKFAVALGQLGVNPPRKVGPSGREQWAFAKTDKDFQALQTAGNEDVQALIAARLGFKSTLEETRTQRFINIADATKNYYEGEHGIMPVALRYSGAHTHRFSGDWSLNLQNLPSRGSTALRDSLIAPPGYTVVTCDASQIEARLTAWFAGQHDLLAQFERGEDVYSSFASKIYGYPVSKKNKVERFLGKTCILGLGFGMGADKFRETVRVQAAAMGIDLPMDLTEARRIVNLYRTTYANIKDTWAGLDDALAVMARDGGGSIRNAMFRKHGILLPSGLMINYHDLKYDKKEGFIYTVGGSLRHIYGGKVLENMVQAYDRIIVINATLRVNRRFPHIDLHSAHQVHDEAVWVVPDHLAEKVKEVAIQEFKRRPDWALDLPLDAEAGSGKSFGACK